MLSTSKTRQNFTKSSHSERNLVLCYENPATSLLPIRNFYKGVKTVSRFGHSATSQSLSIESVNGPTGVACWRDDPMSTGTGRNCSSISQGHRKSLRQKSPQVSFQYSSDDERSPLITKQHSFASGCSIQDPINLADRNLPVLSLQVPLGTSFSSSRSWSSGMALQASASYGRKTSSNSTSRLHSYHHIAHPKRHSAAACSASDIAACGRSRLSLQPPIIGLHSQVPYHHPNRGLHMSTPHTDSSQNPLYEVSSDLMRMTGQANPPFRKLLRQPSGSSHHRDDPSPMPAEVTSPGRLNGSAMREDNAATGMMVDDAENGASRPLGARPKEESGMMRKSIVGRDGRHKNSGHHLSRKLLFIRRTKLINLSMIVALVGIVLMVIDNELTGSGQVQKDKWESITLRILIVSSTLLLLTVIFGYHVCKLQLVMVDSGTDDWRVALSTSMLIQMIIELTICAVCPLPGTGYFTWTYIKSSNNASKPLQVRVPVDLVLSIPMFLRMYLLGRYMVLHSKLFQDAATRSIAALNRINVDFNFVMKTLMHDHPLRVLISFTCCFWLVMSWLLTQCERYKSANGEVDEDSYNYLNSVWLVVITFMSVGYGDIVPHTYCGRGVAICTGTMGIGVASALVAVISRKLDLSKAEKHVNAFMADTKLGKQRKETAARVLQETWFIFKFRYLLEGRDEMRMRLHQRRFLAAIHDFRRVKWDQRKLTEQTNNLIDVAKVQAEVQDALLEMQENQQQLMAEVAQINEGISILNETLSQTLFKRGNTSNFYPSPMELTPNP